MPIFLPPPYPLSPALPLEPRGVKTKQKKACQGGDMSGYGANGYEVYVCEYEYGYEYSMSKKEPPIHSPNSPSP